MGWNEGLLGGGLGFLTDHDQHPLAVNSHIGSIRGVLIAGFVRFAIEISFLLGIPLLFHSCFFI